MRNPIIQEILETVVENLGQEARKLEGATLVISGGAGFIGSYFLGVIHYLNQNVLERPCRVFSIDNYITGSKESFIGDVLSGHIRPIEGDIRKPFTISDPVDYVVHAAGLASPVYYLKYPIETIEATIFGAKNLLEFAREKQVKGFLFFSSSEIYGDPDQKFVPTPETYHGNVSPIGPRACYDESKRLTETICVVYHQLYGMPVKIVRPFNVYGPGMKINDYRVIPTFIVKALTGEPLPVHGHGRQTRTFSFVSDAITGFFKTLLSGKKGEAYNIGSDTEEVDVTALANIIAGIFDNNVEVKLIDYPDGYPASEPMRRCPDISKARRDLNYQPKVDLRTGLKKTISWYRDILPPGYKLPPAKI